MKEYVIDDVKFKLRKYQDFSWLHEYGKVFSVIDETGSGCISFGIERDNKKYFFKIAGAATVDAEISEKESIKLLKEASIKYEKIKHPNLIKLVDSFEINEFFVLVFEWAYGECLFDHWNFDKYKKHPEMDTPIKKFKRLSIEKKLNVVEKLFSFFEVVCESGWVTVDFYDSSIIYDFDNDQVTFCDIDLFRKSPTYNDLGEDYFGTKRLKAPEENILNSIIDEVTCEFTLGAIIFDLLSDVSNVDYRYKKGMFIPNKREEFILDDKKYNILLKATNYEREKRFNSIKEFYEAWNNNL